MAQPRLAAVFFVKPNGAVIVKARPVSDSLRYEIFDRDNGVCQHCAGPVVRHRCQEHFRGPRLGAVDHIVPRARGGQNEPTNLQLLCEPCNASKGAKDGGRCNG